MVKSLILSATLAATLMVPGLAPVAVAQQASTSIDQQARSAATVRVNDQDVLSLASAGDMTAQERAQLVEKRLREALVPAPRAEAKPIALDDITVRTVNRLPVIHVRDKGLITVTYADAKLLGFKSPQQAAERYVGNLRDALRDFELTADRNLPEGFIVVNSGVMSDRTAARTTQRAQQAQRSQQVSFAAVRVNDQEVMRLFDAGDLKAQTRAEMVRERIRESLATGPDEAFKPVQASDINVVRVNNLPVIRLREANLITVTHRDAQMIGTSPQNLAQRWADELRSALADVRVGANESLPDDLVVIATGNMTVPTARTGGGAGQGDGMKDKDKQNKPHDHQHHD